VGRMGLVDLAAAIARAVATGVEADRCIETRCGDAQKGEEGGYREGEKLGGGRAIIIFSRTLGARDKPLRS